MRKDRSNKWGQGALCAALVTCAMLISTSAFATGFEYKLVNKKSQTDGEPPTLVLQATDIVNSAKIELKSATAKNQTVKVGRMNPGATKAIPLKVGKGTHTITVKISAEGAGGQKVEIPAFEFDVVRVDPITLVIDPDGVDMDSREIPFKVNRPVDRVEMAFKDPKGRDLGVHTQNYGGAYGNLKANWPAAGAIGSIEVRVYDVDEFWTSVLLEPWWVEIEHKDVNFDSGKYDIKAGAEEKKLEESLEEIREQMKRNEKHRAGMRLYVAGYTDTVGPEGANQKLSAQRACSIARWFQKNGIDMPVYYQGFGESVLKVKTADNVDEAANRRALYLLGNAKPAPDSSMPKSNWRRVSGSCGG